MVRHVVLALVLGILVTAAPSCGGGEIPAFDGQRAYGYLETQMAFGPRVPGTDAHDRTLQWLTETLGETADAVTAMPFRGVVEGAEMEMQNIVASFDPDNGRRVLLCAHWDSRSHADRDPDPGRWTDPVPGANDGASGVAVLLEIASIIARTEPPVGVDIVLFDGEDQGAYGEEATWLLGSRAYAAAMPAGYRPRYAVLLDMIGDADLSLTRDQTSIEAAPVLWRRIQDEAADIGIPFEPAPMRVVDDHVPLIGRGIPAVDLIDFNYPYWHTTADTADKCSAESLAKIGTLVLRLIYDPLDERSGG